MNSNNNEEEILEDIQIEEDEYEDVSNKNSTTNNKNTNTYEDNTEEDLMYEDEYESVKDEILKSMSMLSSHKESLAIKTLQQKNKNKLNKLSLLLSQKFLNIIFSIISCHIKKNYKIFITNMKSLIIYKFNMINLSKKNRSKNKNKNNIYNKTSYNYNRIKSAKPSTNNGANPTHSTTSNKFYKVPKYYLESLKKQEERKMKKEMIKKHHEEIKKKKQNEDKKKEKETKTNTEIEYEKYQYQKKLEKYNEQERKKYLEDLIRKENYADNIYKFMKKKTIFYKFEI